MKFGSISHVEKLREAGGGLATLKENPRHTSGNILINEAEVAAPKAAG